MPEPIVEVGTNDIDFNSTPSEGLPIVDTTTTKTGPAPVHVTGDEGVQRSTRKRKEPSDYVPSMTDKKYSFATTELGTTFLEDESYQHNQLVAFAFMQPLSVKAALKQWGSEADVAGQKEASQLHWRDTFIPKLWSELSEDQKSKILEIHMFIVKKRLGKTKEQLFGGGNKQHDYLTKEESSSPTAATESVLLTSIVNAAERRDVAIINIPNAFIQMRVEREKDCVIIRIRDVVFNWLVKIAPDIYGQYETVGKNKEKQLLVECMNKIYGTMVAGLLYYRKFAESLGQRKLTVNPYDPCV
jgi:hypothetical protein